MLFNHILTYIGDLEALTPELYSSTMKIAEVIDKVEDEEAKKALLLASTRMLYKNQKLVGRMADSKDKYVKAMNEFKGKQQPA